MSSDSQLKQLVADAILEPRGGFVFNKIPPDVLNIEVSKVSNLQAQVRVTTQSDGVHYYTVQVSENL